MASVEKSFIIISPTFDDDPGYPVLQLVNVDKLMMMMGAVVSLGVAWDGLPCADSVLALAMRGALFGEVFCAVLYLRSQSIPLKRCLKYLCIGLHTVAWLLLSAFWCSDGRLHDICATVAVVCFPLIWFKWLGSELSVFFISITIVNEIGTFVTWRQRALSREPPGHEQPLPLRRLTKEDEENTFQINPGGVAIALVTVMLASFVCCHDRVDPAMRALEQCKSRIGSNCAQFLGQSSRVSDVEEDFASVMGATSSTMGAGPVMGPATTFVHPGLKGISASEENSERSTLYSSAVEVESTPRVLPGSLPATPAMPAEGPAIDQANIEHRESPTQKLAGGSLSCVETVKNASDSCATDVENTQKCSGGFLTTSAEGVTPEGAKAGHCHLAASLIRAKGFAKALGSSSLGVDFIMEEELPGSFLTERVPTTGSGLGMDGSG